MAEETISTETVKKTSDGMVKISLEKYEELTAKAAEPKSYYPTYVQKTAEQAANDMIAMGAVSMGGGAVLLVAGGIMVLKGLRDLKAL